MNQKTTIHIVLKIVTGLLIVVTCIGVGYMFGTHKALLREANSRAILCTHIADVIRSGRTDVALTAIELMASGSVSSINDYEGFGGASRLTRILFTARLDERDGCVYAADYLARHEEAFFEPEAANYLRAHYPNSFSAAK